MLPEMKNKHQRQKPDICRKALRSNPLSTSSSTIKILAAVGDAIVSTTSAILHLCSHYSWRIAMGFYVHDRTKEMTIIKNLIGYFLGFSNRLIIASGTNESPLH
jgi:hypothetical protein